MLWNDLSDGSIKTFLILGLLAANIALLLPDQHAPAPARETRALPGEPPR